MMSVARSASWSSLAGPSSHEGCVRGSGCEPPALAGLLSSLGARETSQHHYLLPLLAFCITQRDLPLCISPKCFVTADTEPGEA